MGLRQFRFFYRTELVGTLEIDLSNESLRFSLIKSADDLSRVACAYLSSFRYFETVGSLDSWWRSRVIPLERASRSVETAVANVTGRSQLEELIDARGAMPYDDAWFSESDDSEWYTRNHIRANTATKWGDVTKWQ